jgi:hypothetical protein
MLKFSSGDEYFAYLNQKMSANHAKQLVQDSEEPLNETSTRFTNIRIRTPDQDDNDHQRSKSPNAFYNVQNAAMISESNTYEEQDDRLLDRSLSSSSLSSDMLITNTFSSSRNIPQYV